MNYRNVSKWIDIIIMIVVIIYFDGWFIIMIIIMIEMKLVNKLNNFVLWMRNDNDSDNDNKKWKL